LAGAAVRIAPVSTQFSLQTGKTTGNFAQSRTSGDFPQQQREILQKLSGEIPYANEQGNLFAEQGSLR
jgi:hypothetical protein